MRSGLILLLVAALCLACATTEPKEPAIVGGYTLVRANGAPLPWTYRPSSDTTIIYAVMSGYLCVYGTPASYSLTRAIDVTAGFARGHDVASDLGRWASAHDGGVSFDADMPATVTLRNDTLIVVPTSPHNSSYWHPDSYTFVDDGQNGRNACGIPGSG